MTSKECRLCHRIGSRDFLVAGAEEWECANDRACKARKKRRDRAESEERWNQAVDTLLNSRFVAGEYECTEAFWAYVDEKITLSALREALL